MFRSMLALQKLFIPCAVLGLLAVCSASALAENWVAIPGRVVFDSNNGQVESIYFSTWATNKETFVPAAMGNDLRKAGYFSYVNDDEHAVIHVTDAKSYHLQGNENPIIITFRDGGSQEVEVVNSFIWAIARMDAFHFRTFDEHLGQEVTYSIASEAVRRLYFYPE